MTTLTIEIKKKAKRLLEDLQDLDLLKIMDTKESSTDLEWLDFKKIPHAKRILNAYTEAALAADGKIELKTLDQLLSEL